MWIIMIIMRDIRREEDAKHCKSLSLVNNDLLLSYVKCVNNALISLGTKGNGLRFSCDLMLSP